MLPHSIQHNWERFCLQVALPLEQCHLDVPLEDNEVLVTRRRWDCYFVPAILLLAAAAVFCAWQLRIPRLLLSPLALSLVWLVVRSSTPSEGLRSRRGSKEPERGFLLFLFIWAVIALLGSWTLTALAPRLRWGPALVALWLVFCLAVLFVQACRADRHKQQAQQPMAALAAEEWDRTVMGEHDGPGNL